MLINIQFKNYVSTGLHDCNDAFTSLISINVVHLSFYENFVCICFFFFFNVKVDLLNGFSEHN